MARGRRRRGIQSMVDSGNALANEGRRGTGTPPRTRRPLVGPGMGSGGPAVSNNSPQGQAMMQQMMQQRRRRRRPNNPPPGTAYMPQMGPMASPLAKKKKK